MQMDEDIGKVSMATPILISRSMELFLQLLLEETLKTSERHQSRRLLPGHMKETIMNQDKFDFLRDLVNDIDVPNTNTNHGEN
jgi:hypothetical protein